MVLTPYAGWIQNPLLYTLAQRFDETAIDWTINNGPLPKHKTAKVGEKISDMQQEKGFCKV